VNRCNIKPPRIAEFILSFCLSKSDLHRLGDYEEIFQHIAENESRLKAYRWYWLHTIRSLPELIKNIIYWGIAMLNNYIKISLRNIIKHKVFSFINIFGLALGLACFLLIFLWVHDEFKFDRFHENRDEIFQVYSDLQYSNGSTQIITGSYYPLSGLIKKECPEVLQSIRFLTTSGLIISYGEKSYRNDVVGLTDPSVFNIFTFPFIDGDPQTALSEKFSIVITSEMASKFFGSEKAIGKILRINNELDLQVTGVIENVPQHSSIQFDCLVSFVLQFAPDFKNPTHWGGNQFTTFVMLHKDADISNVAIKITDIAQKYNPSEITKEDFYLFSMKDMHLHLPQGGGLFENIMIFSLVALFVLIIACINFMNLSTSKSTTRANEVGLRKVIGAKRTDLISQFVGESIILAFIALILAVLLVLLFLPVFNSLLSKHLTLNVLSNPYIILVFISITLIAGLISGSYPAFYLSTFQPACILKNVLTYAGGGARFRKILVIVQFSISTILIIGTVTIFKQLDFIKNKDMGFDRDNIIYLNIPDNINKNYESVKNELLQNHNILNVSRSLQHPAYIGSSVSKLDWDGKNQTESVNMNWDVVDYDFIETFKIDLLEGRSFAKEHGTDISEAFIINEEAQKVMNMVSPIGKRLSVFGSQGKIIGVVKNFHFQPLSNKIQPFIFMMNPDWSKRNMFINVRPENISETLKYIETVYKKFETESPFAIHAFNDVLLNLNYTAEQNLIQISGYFTILAIVISALGLFGLASFVAERRTKEIGIRKVLGASVTGMVFMLSKDFTKWVLVSIIIAWPVANLIIQKLLEKYVYRTDIGFEIFILSGLLTLMIALLTVSYQAIKAAIVNPVESIKYE